MFNEKYGKSAETVSIKNRSTKEKNLEIRKRKKRVDPKVDAKKRQIGANAQDIKKKNHSIPKGKSCYI